MTMSRIIDILLYIKCYISFELFAWVLYVVKNVKKKNQNEINDLRVDFVLNE